MALTGPVEHIHRQKQKLKLAKRANDRQLPIADSGPIAFGNGSAANYGDNTKKSKTYIMWRPIFSHNTKYANVIFKNIR